MVAAARALSWRFLSFGAISAQRGRRAQLSFMTSRIRSAVVLPSSVTALTSGAGGAFTLAHSAITSAALTGAANAATTAVEYNRVLSMFMLFSREFILSCRFHQLYC